MKLRKAIEASPSNLNFMRECVASNPRYLVTATETPNILHQGPRHNALHVAAKWGKEEAARLVIMWVVGGELLSRLYPEEVGNLEERVARVTKVLQRQAIDLTQVWTTNFNLYGEFENSLPGSC